MSKEEEQKLSPEQQERIKRLRVVQLLLREKSTKEICDTVNIPRQKVLTYVRQAFTDGIVQLRPSCSRLGEDLKQELGRDARNVNIDVIQAKRDSPGFYEACAERLLDRMRAILVRQGKTTVAVGGGRTIYKMVRNMSGLDGVEADEARRIMITQATSGLDPIKALYSPVIVSAQLRTVLDPPDANIADAPFKAIVSDPYTGQDIQRRMKSNVDILISSVGHKSDSYCASVSGLATAPDDATVGEFLLQPYDDGGIAIEPSQFFVDCATDSAQTPDPAERRVRTFYSLYSLSELAQAAKRDQPKPYVIVIATNYLPDVQKEDQEACGKQGSTESRDISKVDAVLGALRGGFISHLILPMDFAEELLQRVIDNASPAEW